MYGIRFAKVAEKQLSRLERAVQERIIATLERIKVRPYPHVKRLVGCPYFRLRVGDYRVILDIQDRNALILVIKVGHRKSVYQ